MTDIAVITLLILLFTRRRQLLIRDVLLIIPVSLFIPQLWYERNSSVEQTESNCGMNGMQLWYEKKSGPGDFSQCCV